MFPREAVCVCTLHSSVLDSGNLPESVPVLCSVERVADWPHVFVARTQSVCLRPFCVFTTSTLLAADVKRNNLD